MLQFGLISDDYKILGKKEENFTLEEKGQIEKILVDKIKNNMQSLMSSEVDKIRNCMSRYDNKRNNN